jgi:hypothetical protein
MPWPVKFLFLGMFATFFVGALVLARKNLERGSYFRFWTMDWAERSERGWEFYRQTYGFPVASGMALAFTLFQMVRN